MSGHFAAIGFAFDDQAAMRAGLAAVGGDAVEVARSSRALHLQWLDPSGASVAFHLDDRSRDLVCVTPFFAPTEPTLWQARSHGATDDASCAHCGGAACDLLVAGEVVTRAIVQWVCFQPYRDWLRAARRYPLEVVGFARAAEVFADGDAFEASPASRADDGGEPRLARNGFVPIGMLGDDDDLSQRATARFAGRIRAAALLRNGQTGGTFWRLRVDTLPGTIDVVAAEQAILGEPRVGGHALVDAWLVGRPAVPPPPPSRSIWQRLRSMTGRS